jgi:hypothetical protein
MKTQNIIFWFSFILLIVVVSGCVQPTEGLATPSPAISILLPTSSVAPTSLFTAQPADSPTSTPTPTMIPTLSTEEARILLLKLLANNGDCQLPCLWGIVPEMSSFQEAQTILAPLSSLSHSVYLNPPGPGSISPRYTEGDLEIYTTTGFLTNPDNNLVNHIAFRAEAHRPLKEGGYEDVFDSKFFGEKVSAYMLPHILSDQGVPSAVMIATSGGPLTRGGTGGFDILLLYPDQGILVNYTTQMHYLKQMFRDAHPMRILRWSYILLGKVILFLNSSNRLTGE